MLRPGQCIRQLQCVSQPAIALHRQATTSPVILAQHCERQLVREYLVISEPLARLFIGLHMDAFDGPVPGRPLPVRQQAGLDPLVELGQTVQPLAHQPGQPLLRHTIGERIDRLGHRDLVNFGRTNDMVGMDDLPAFAIDIEPPRREPGFAKRP